MLAPQFQRRQFCFSLDALVVIEINIVVDQYIGLLKGGSLMSVNTLGFENGKEVFCHCVVIAISAS